MNISNIDLCYRNINNIENINEKLKIFRKDFDCRMKKDVSNVRAKSKKTTTRIKTRKIEKVKNVSQIDMPLLITVLMLLAIGIIMVLSASAPSALAMFGDSYKYAKTQGIASIAGICCMIFFSIFDHKHFKKWYKVFYVIGVLLLFTVKIPGLGVSSNGATRWIKIGLQIQPSEITKICMILFFAGYFTDEKNDTSGLWKGYLLPLLLIVLPVYILYKVQNHMSAGILLVIITLAIMIMAGCKMKYIMTTIAAAGGVGVLALIFFRDKLTGSFRTDRIQAWLNTEENARGSGYQTLQSLYAIGSGGLFGVGLGESKQKYLYIPEAHNDFIFAILAEELGFVGCLIVLILFAIFTVRGVLISMKADDMFGSLMAIGITTLISSQAILNIAVVTNTIPNTGISLPFLSYGGSSIIILLSCVGILLNISKTTKKI